MLTAGVVLLLSVVGGPSGVAQLAAAENQWELFPTNYSVTFADNGRHGVTYPYGAVYTEDTDSGLRIEGTRYGDYLELELRGPEGPDGFAAWRFSLRGDIGLLTKPGVYQTKRIADPGQLSFDLSNGCGSSAPGRVDILDVGVDSMDRITRMWLRYEFGCDGAHALMTGDVRWGYPEQTFEAAPTSVMFPATQPGAQSPISAVRLHKGVGASYSAARLEGPDAASFTIASDRCPSADAASSDCVVRLRFAPTRAGAHVASLVAASGNTTVRVPLEGRGLPGTYRMVVDTDPEGLWGDRDVDAQPGPFELTAAIRPLWTDRQTFAASIRDASSEGFSMRFNTAPEQPFATGSFESKPEWPPSGAFLDLSFWQGTTGRGCSTGADHGRWNVYQVLSGRAPAYEVDFEHSCGTAQTASGHIWYGARADVTGPTTASDLRRPDPRVLTWNAPGDAVHSVVRARRGGHPTSAFDTGELLYSGSGERASLPAAYTGKPMSYTVFTLDAAGNVSAPAQLIVRGTTAATLRSSRATIRSGGRVKLSGVLTQGSWGHRVPGRTVQLQARRPGSTWRTVRTVTSSRLGQYAFDLTPGRTRYYRVRIVASATHLPAHSPVVRVTVR